MKNPSRKLPPLRLTKAQWRLVGVALKHWGFVLKCEAEKSAKTDKAKYQKGRKMGRLAKRVREACDKN